jgi:hypothetical protein
MFDHIRAADRFVLLLNTLLLMVVAFLPFAASVLADALRDGHDERTAIVFYGIAFAVTALTFNAVWQYACRHRLLGERLDSAGATAIGRRFQLAVAWLAAGALLGALLPVLGVVAPRRDSPPAPLRPAASADPPSAWRALRNFALATVSQGAGTQPWKLRLFNTRRGSPRWRDGRRCSVCRATSGSSP